MLLPNYLMVVDDIIIPDFLIELAMCQENKIFVEDEIINKWVTETITPVVLTHPLVRGPLVACSNHVHISHKGLTPHDHRPHLFTSVLYLADAEGNLVVNPMEDEYYINPKQGRLVVFPGESVHMVQESPSPELRISLVTNYEYPSI